MLDNPSKKLRANSSHSQKDRGADAYFTPPEATRALLRLESNRIPKSVADPCCGNGAILKVLAEAGYVTHARDVRDYGYPHTVVQDYLATPMAMSDVGIVTNPPYRCALEFIRKAIRERAIYHAWLLRLAFLESYVRKPFFEAHPPSRIWVSSRRLPRMHREGWTGPRASSNVPFAWFV